MRLLGRLAFALAVVLVIVVLLEVLFRVGGFWASATPRPAPDGSTVVLCVGDSHTRGRPDPDNYPAQLERILNERAPRPYRVLNLGVPGQNTGQVRVRFERYLAYYRPAVVLHWGGVNNAWNQAERANRNTSLLGRIAESSRLVRFARVAFFYRRLGRTLEAPAVTGHDWGRPEDGARTNFAGVEDDIRRRPSIALPQEEIEAITHDDLAAMMRIAWGNGIPMYLVTYAWWGEGFRPVNDAIRSVSAEFNVPFIDSALAVTAASREAPGAELFDAWVHPMPIVYRHVAEEAFRTLVSQGVVVPVPDRRG